jgi:hypothetical protein
VIYPHPSDLDRKVENEERGELTGRGRRRGSVVLDLHGEALSAGSDSEGVLDGVQEVTAMMMAK